MKPLKPESVQKSAIKRKMNTILFDLDGTIVDTEATAVDAVQGCLEDWNIPFDPKDSEVITGITWEAALEHLFGKYPIPHSPENAKKQIIGRYRDQLQNHLRAVPGSINAIQSLAPHYSLGLVSGSPHKDILWALNQFNIATCFRTILGAEDYPRSKPHPDGYLKALRELHGTPATGLVFEDSTAGIQSARAAGLWVVAITSTNHFGQDTSAAHFQIPDFKMVSPDWVENLSFD